MKKKLAILSLCLTMAAASLTACGGGNTETTAAPAAAPVAEAAGSEGALAGAKAAGDLAELTAGMCEGPVVLTSVGQSADVNVVQTLFKKAEVEVNLNATLKAEDLKDYKTLVLAVGGSSKGLGAAGIDENQEIERVKAVIAEAQNQGLTIVTLHIGGSARRGTLSDKFIPDAFQAANAAIVVSEGDSDNMMRDILSANGTPAAYVDNQVGAVDPIKTIFGK